MSWEIDGVAWFPASAIGLRLGTKYDIRRTSVGVPPCMCYSVAELSRYLLTVIIVAAPANLSSHSEDRRRCSKVSFHTLLAPICLAGTRQVIPPLGQLAPMSPNQGLAECSRWQHLPPGTAHSLVRPPSSMNQHD